MVQAFQSCPILRLPKFAKYLRTDWHRESEKSFRVHRVHMDIFAGMANFLEKGCRNKKNFQMRLLKFV